MLRSLVHGFRPLAALALALPVALLPCAAAADSNGDRPIDREPSRVALPASATAVQADSAFAIYVTNNNLVAMTVSNYGFLGNNFSSRDASLVYPSGAAHAYEHMVRGGIWVGAQAQDVNGLFTGVVTATTDGNQGSAGNGATEWTPIGTSIVQRSILPNSPYYTTAAVSEQDLISKFDDRVVRRAAQNAENHRPIGVEVTQETYSWSFSEYANCVILHYTLRNKGPLMQNVWVGFYNEFASGDKTLYTDRNIWPPSSTGSVVGGWFNKKWIEYDEADRLYREHYCASLPIPDGCGISIAPYWIGVRVLGVHGLAEDTTTKRISLTAWSWDPSSTLRDQDAERYAIMSSGLPSVPAGDTLLPGTGDPVSVLAIGPFPLLYTDSTVVVDFAIVGGAEIADIREHSRFAQRAFDRGYIIPIPPPSPRFKTVARDGAIDFYWDDSPEFAEDPTSPQTRDWEGYRVYVGDAPLEMHRVAQFDNPNAPGDTTGFNTGVQPVRLNPPVTIDGVTYQYKHTVASLRNGFKYFCAVTSYDLGNTEVESLESSTAQNVLMTIPGPAPGERPSSKVSVFPNPYRVEAAWDVGRGVRDHYLWFTNLPKQCTIRIFTLAGDQIFETKFDGDTYRGEGSRGIYDPKVPVVPHAPVLSGTTYGWNLITDQGQAVATGLYLFTVEDASGNSTVGKFLIVKSDREEF